MDVRILVPLVAVMAVSAFAYFYTVFPTQADSNLVTLHGRFNVMWLGGNESAENKYFLTDSEGGKIEIKVTPSTKLSGAWRLSGFDGKMLNVLGRLDNSTGVLEAISIG